MIVYWKRRRRQQQQTAPVAVSRSTTQEISRFIRDVVQSGADAEAAARQFLREHPNAVTYLKGAAIAIAVATIIEDIASLGVGVADDPATLSVAYTLWRVAQTFR